MDAVRKAFGYPFTELVQPAGRKRLVPKGALNGAVNGIGLAGILYLREGLEDWGIGKGLKQCAERHKLICIKSDENLPENLLDKQVVFVNNLLYNMYSGLYIG